MPNIQFNTTDEIYFLYKNLNAKDKRAVNDALRNVLINKIAKYKN